MATSMVSLPQQTRIFLSLAGLFFFAPYVQFFVKKITIVISPEDKNFILWYAKLGYVSLVLAAVVAIMGAYNFIQPTLFVELAYTVAMYLLVALLVIGSVFIFSHTPLIKHADDVIYSISKIEQSQKDVLKSFLPWYNFHLWYKVHKFDHPFWLLKESLLWTLLLVASVLMTHSVLFVGIVVLLIITRLITLMSGYDILPLQWKKNINSLFMVNIEELRWDLKWLCLYTWQYYISKKDVVLKDLMLHQRREYTQLHSFTWNVVLFFEYTFFVLFLLYYAYGLYSWYLFGLRLGIEVLALWLLAARYLIMIPYKQYPLIPVLHECAQLLVWIGKKVWIKN